MFGLYAAGIVERAGDFASLPSLSCWRDYEPSPFMHGTARLQAAAREEHRASASICAPRRSSSRRHHDLLDDGADLVPCLFPAAASGRRGPAINYSLAAMIGHADPAGARAARLQLANRGRADPRHGGTRSRGRGPRHGLCDRRRQGAPRSRSDRCLPANWSLATALALLVWYIFAPQCASTLAVIRRETGSWKWMAVTFSYMLALAYIAVLPRL